MFTYLAINLSNKKFQVGSTTNFPKRCKEHHAGKGDLEFQRSLRKNPENFFWFCSVDDLQNNRDEEQFYLDFYCGTEWCYNHNPSAKAPPSPKGRKLSDKTKQKIGEGNKGKKRPDLSEYNKSNPRSGVDNPMYGKSREDLRKRNLENNSSSGKHWFTNKERTEEVLAFESPGEGWIGGRIKRI